MASIQNGSVHLIDPMDVVSNLGNQLHGTPRYEQMFIFAELSAERRGRSVLTFNSTKGTISVDQTLGDIKLNLMGVDQSNPNDSELTTRWTNNIDNTTTPYEGFGISNIKVKISSSFIPQVTIEFIDIRGLAFFNLGENSPYSVVFDFPPPIFNLTLKGYYGRALNYQLHLVRHSTRFDAKTGNYYTTAEFIARTFAPLTDIPFKFVDIIPLIDQQTQEGVDPVVQQTILKDGKDSVNTERISPDERVAPRNTHELIIKLKALYDRINVERNTSPEAEAYQESLSELQKGISLFNRLNVFSNSLSPDIRNGAAIIIKELDDLDSDTSGKFRIVDGVGEYDNVIKSDSSDAINFNKNERLYLAVLSQPNISGNTTLSQSTVQSRINKIDNELRVIRNSLLRQGSEFTDISTIENSIDIGLPEEIINDQIPNAQNTDQNIRYRAIDISVFYQKIYKFLNKKRTDVDEAQASLVGLINIAAEQELGLRPTLYNIMKIICDDIDILFNKIRKTNVDAENHHIEFQNQILSEVKDTKIGAFPLYISANTTCGIVREARAFPEQLSNRLDRPFPEVNLINDFIDAFIQLEKEELVRDLKRQEDTQGNNKWIPVTPVDSVLSGNLNYTSPYANIEINGIEDNIINSIYATILNRFYIASQYTYGKDFYATGDSRFLGFGDRELKRIDLIKLAAGSEAANLANSLINNNTVLNLIDKIKQFKNNPDQFYTTLENENVSNFSNINPDDRLLLTDGTPLFKNRSNLNYLGIRLLEGDDFPSIRQPGDSDSQNQLSPVDQFLDQDTGLLQQVINAITRPEENRIKTFTQENVGFFPELDLQTDSFESRYIRIPTNDFPRGANINSFVDSWASVLTRDDLNILNFLTGNTYSDKTKAFWIVSNFGRSISYFNFFARNQFRFPGVVEVSSFSVAYMGGLIQYNDPLNNNIASEINNLYTNDFASAERFSINNIDRDSQRVMRLSNQDSQIFSNAFETFITDSDQFRTVLNNIIEMILEMQNLIENGEIDPNQSLIDSILGDNEKTDKYIEFLTDTGEYRSTISEILNERKGILNFNEFTFSVSENVDDEYEPLSVSNLDISPLGKKTANDIYFNEFFRVLGIFLPKRERELNNLDANFRTSISDNDIKTQLYYTFKSISDKWIAGLGSDLKGFPLNNGINDSLISKFAFVDRAMNPIGNDVIINVEPLIEMSQDYDSSVFTVISKLLSLNGFEFFPLQNFMSFTEKEWENSFRIFESANQVASPTFVCMYIGGTSTQLNSINSDYDDDGILDLGNEDLQDFKNDPNCENSPEVIDKQNINLGGGRQYRYSEVRAFRVGYAEQNQSFFTDIQLDSREYPETVESLAILSRIAGDESKTSPVPKGQNLFSVYETRSYSAKISMLGNMMIQPTQYFQLENIPMYGGAYVILDVEHDIIPNHMITSFQGVRILKYPNPFVKDFATSIGIQSGTSEDLTGSQSVAASTINSTSSFGDTGSNSLPIQAQHNSMFTLKIR